MGRSQCVDRRFAVYAAQLEEFDAIYDFDLATEPFHIRDNKRDAKTRVIDYISQAYSFATTHFDEFCDTYLEPLADLTEYVSINEAEAEVSRLLNLYQHHSKSVEKAYLRMQEKHYSIYDSERPNSIYEVVNACRFQRIPAERLAADVANTLSNTISIALARTKINHENALNDHIQALLKRDGADFEREYPTVRFSFATAIPDHSTTQADSYLFIESKYIRDKTSPSPITEQIVNDLIKYPAEAFKLFIVYDPTRHIKDDNSFKRDYERRLNCYDLYHSLTSCGLCGGGLYLCVMETGVYIPIISDYGFKATFGNEADSLFLRTALQALIKSDTPIREVHFDKNAFEALTIDSRSGIFDVSCTDEQGNQFIVEMQLGYAPHFIQRMKFYALHRFNPLAERGEFDYANLPKLYTIAFLEKNILPTAHFHTVANLRSEAGEIIDSQMTFIIVELAKFTKQVGEIETDLEKLVYTMKTLHTTETTQYPAFWNEEWLRRAIDELDTRKMTPEERAYFARVTAANAEAVKAEKQKIREAVEQKEAETVKNALLKGLDVNLVADIAGVSVEFVKQIQQQQ